MEENQREEEIIDLRAAYDLLIQIYKRYLDMEEKYYPIVAAWTIGAFFHRCFPTYPYLFLNAMKGSGKTRLEKLNAYILDGTWTTNITEAVLFRENTPLFVDEVENINRKEKAGLRELLNVAYKAGGVVKRARNIPKTGHTVIDAFDVYRPICLANIDGLDDVLEDRCIRITLERSFNVEITRRVEYFFLDHEIRRLKDFFKKLHETTQDYIVEGGSSVVLHVDVKSKVIEDNVTTPSLEDSGGYYIVTPSKTQKIIADIYEVLGHYFIYGNITTPNTINYLPNINYTTTLILNKVNNSELLGRDLELFLPLFVVGSMIDEKIVNNLFEYATEISKDRQETNIIENRDVILLNFLTGFIADKLSGEHWTYVSDIVKDFFRLSPGTEKEMYWFNNKWVGRALVRNNLIQRKRRLSRGMEIILNHEKIKERAKRFGIDVITVQKEYLDAQGIETTTEPEELTPEDPILQTIVRFQDSEAISNLPLIIEALINEKQAQNEEEAHKIINNLVDKNLIFEPRPGYFRRL